MSIDRQTYRKTKKKRQRKKLSIWILTPFLLLILGATTYGAYLHNKVGDAMEGSYEPLDRDKEEKEETKKADPKVDNTSILFIGVDDSDARGYNSGARSDALLLATFNEKGKSVKLVSIPRDSYVYVPEIGREDKITHAHAYGGPKAAIETVEELFDIPIDYYVKMNFNAFIDVVDALGGIEVEVPYALSEMDSEDRKNAIRLEPGLQLLDGEEALALARTRKLDSDIERGKRQQEIVKAIIKKAISVKGITKYADVIEAVGDNMATDLSFNDVKSFFDYAVAGTSLEIESLNLTGSNTYIGNVYYYQLDENDLNVKKQLLKSHLDTMTTSERQVNDLTNS